MTPFGDVDGYSSDKSFARGVAERELEHEPGVRLTVRTGHPFKRLQGLAAVEDLFVVGAQFARRFHGKQFKIVFPGDVLRRATKETFERLIHVHVPKPSVL